MTGKKKNRFTALSSADFAEPEVRDTSKTAMGASPDVSHIAAVLVVRSFSLAGYKTDWFRRTIQASINH